jgi:hypothetical protein
MAMLAVSAYPGLFDGTLMEGITIRRIDQPCGFLLPPTHIVAVIATESLGFLVQYQISLDCEDVRDALQGVLQGCGALPAGEADVLLDYVERTIKWLERHTAGTRKWHGVMLKAVQKERWRRE